MCVHNATYRWMTRMAVGVTCALAIAMFSTAKHGIAADDALLQSQRDDESKTEKPKSKSKALDDVLLDDLDNELLDGAGDLKGRGAKPKPEGTKADDDKSKSPPDPDTIGEDIGMPSEDEQADPLVQISQDMRSVEELIPKLTSRAHAEELQRQIVENLSKLIDQAEAQRAAQQAAAQKKKQPSSTKRQSVKQSKPGAANSAQNSNKPAQDSTNRLGKAEDARPPDPELMKGLMKDSWGNLPPRAREQMLQNSPERFLPQYELMIERYYQRLAEESGSK